MYPASGPLDFHLGTARPAADVDGIAATPATIATTASRLQRTNVRRIGDSPQGWTRRRPSPPGSLPERIFGVGRAQVNGQSSLPRPGMGHSADRGPSTREVTVTFRKDADDEKDKAPPGRK